MLIETGSGYSIRMRHSEANISTIAITPVRLKKYKSHNETGPACVGVTRLYCIAATVAYPEYPYDVLICMSLICTTSTRINIQS